MSQTSQKQINLTKEQESIDEVSVRKGQIAEAEQNELEEENALSQSKRDLDLVEPNKNQIFVFILLDILAGITTGYGLAYTNNCLGILGYVFHWDTKAEQDLNNSLISSALPLGAMIGASTGGRLIPKGRRLTVFIAAALGMFGCSLTVWKNEYLIIIGRIIYGMSSGCLAAAIQRYVDEYIPLKWFDSVAPLYGVGLNLGTLTATFTVYMLPDTEKDSVEVLENDETWRYIFGFPIVLNFLLICGFLLLVTTDTPKYYLLVGNREMAAKAVSQTYLVKSEADIEKMLVALESNIETGTAKVSIKTAFTDPYYKGCSWLNILNVIFHELDGINVIFLYSSVILGKVLTGNFTAREGVQCINLVNTFSSFVAIWTLTTFGRRTLILFGQLSIAAIHAIIATCILLECDIGIIVSMATFCAIYQNTSGPVAWIYSQETLTDAALGIVLNTLFGTILVLSLSTPYLIDSKLQASGTFYLFSLFALIGFFVLYPTFKETKGLTEKEKKELYVPIHLKKSMMDQMDKDDLNSPLTGIMEGEEVDYVDTR